MKTEFNYTVLVTRRENGETPAKCGFMSLTDARHAYNYFMTIMDTSKFGISLWDNEEEICLMQK